MTQSGLHQFLRSKTAPPGSDEVEVTIFGPGYGECILIHIGAGRWIVIDSCRRHGSKTPIALEYLQTLNVNPAEAIQLVVVSHWHEDHTSGMGDLVAAIPKAKVALPNVLGGKEFRTYTRLVSSLSGQMDGKGVVEMNKVFAELRRRPADKVRIERPVRDQRLLEFPATKTAQNCEGRVFALSPAPDDERAFVDALIAKIGELEAATTVGTLQKATINHEPNDVAVAVHVLVGSIAVLLGSDLEESGYPTRGWCSVHEIHSQFQKASVLKIAHHGSHTAHHEGVWTDMCEPEVLGVMTPYNRGWKLPKKSDATRLLGKTQDLYITASPKQKKLPAHRDHGVARLFEKVAGKPVPIEPGIGAVRLRRSAAAGSPAWAVETFGTASKVSEILNDLA